MCHFAPHRSCIDPLINKLCFCINLLNKLHKYQSIAYTSEDVVEDGISLSSSSWKNGLIRLPIKFNTGNELPPDDDGGGLT